MPGDSVLGSGRIEQETEHTSLKCPCADGQQEGSVVVKAVLLWG